MYKKPTTNETNIIRAIFNESLINEVYTDLPPYSFGGAQPASPSVVTRPPVNITRVKVPTPSVYDMMQQAGIQGARRRFTPGFYVGADGTPIRVETEGGLARLKGLAAEATPTPAAATPTPAAGGATRGAVKGAAEAATAAPKASWLKRAGKFAWKGLVLPTVADIVTTEVSDWGLKKAGMKGGAGQNVSGQKAAAPSPGALDYARQATSSELGALAGAGTMAALGVGGAPVALAAGSIAPAWLAGRAIGKQLGVGDTEDSSFWDLTKDTIASIAPDTYFTDSSRVGRAYKHDQAMDDWVQSGKALSAARAAVPHKKAMDRRNAETVSGHLTPETIQSAEQDLKERGVEGFKAAYGRDAQLMDWLRSKTEPASVPVTKSEPAPALPSAAAGVSTATTPKPAVVTTTAKPASVEETGRGIINGTAAPRRQNTQYYYPDTFVGGEMPDTPAATPARPKLPDASVPAAKPSKPSATPRPPNTLPDGSRIYSKPVETRQAPQGPMTTTGRETGIGPNKTAFQPDQTWDEVASRYIPDQFKGLPITRRDGKVYAGNVEMTAASQEIAGRYSENAPTRAQLNIRESYYTALCQRLDEELGINRAAYSKRGGGPAAVRKAKASLASGGWSGDSADVEDLPKRERMSRKGGVDPDWFTKKAVIKFMADALAAGQKPTHQEMMRMANAALEAHRKDPSQFTEFLPQPGEKKPQFNLNPQKDLAEKLAKARNSSK